MAVSFQYVGQICHLSKRFVKMAVIWLPSSQKDETFLNSKKDFYGDIPSQRLKRSCFVKVVTMKQVLAGSRCCV